MRPPPRDVDPAEDDAPAARRHESRERAQRGRLPRAVGADDRHDLTLPDRDRDAVDRGDVPVVDAEVDQLKHPARSEEHTSELQSLAYLVCRLLLEKKKKGRDLI